MKNFLLGLGKIITFLVIISILLILIKKLFLEFPDLDPLIVLYCLLFCLGLILLVMPEIKEIKFGGFGLKKEDLKHPKITVEKESIKSDATS